MQQQLAEVELREGQEATELWPCSSASTVRVSNGRASTGASPGAMGGSASAGPSGELTMPAAGPLLPTLADEERLEQGRQVDVRPAPLRDDANADALVAAYADQEMRQVPQRQLGKPALKERRGSGPAPTAERSASGSPSMAQLSVEATAGGDAGQRAAWAQDPVLKAWLVTRAAPDLPVRGWVQPPGRAACRQVAAKEMRE